MSRFLICHVRLVIWVLFVTSLAGCVVSEERVGYRYFWPIPVDGVEPKIEYLGFLQTDKDLRGSKEANWITRNVYGEYLPVTLFDSPFFIDLLPGERIAVTDLSLHQVLILDELNGEVRALSVKSGKEPFFFVQPLGIAGSETGHIFVVDSLRGKVLKFGADEKIIDVFFDEGAVDHPVGLALNDRDKLVFVSDMKQHNIAVFDFMGNLLYKFGDAFAGVMANPFYIKIGFTKIEIANVSKIFGVFATLMVFFWAAWWSNASGFCKAFFTAEYCRCFPI